MRHLTSKEKLVAMSHGVFGEVEILDGLTPREMALAKAVAACLTLSGSALSHHTAALAHDLPLLGSRPTTPTLTMAIGGGRSGRRSRASTLRIAALPPEHVDRRGGWAVTTVARTVCDLARETSLLDGLVAADAALSRRLSSLPQLQLAAHYCETWPGGRRLHEVICHANGAAESPYETVARWHLLEAHLRSLPQVWAYDGHGPIGCGDLWVPALWVFLEIDGDVKYAADAKPTTLLVEKRRQERLEEAGFGVARVSAKEARPDVLVERVHKAATRGRVARAACDAVTGYVGPPPPWARRGLHVERTEPPPSSR